MKSRPILFSGAMVQAILSGAKTQTRRVVKPQPHPEFLKRGVVEVVPQWPLQDGVRWFMADGMSELVKCPYGKPGDQLWVRETFAYLAGDSTRVIPESRVAYRADREGKSAFDGQWTPSIFMPRKYSRITLEITGVRVERLQSITHEDAMAEGVEKKGEADFISTVHPIKGTWQRWPDAVTAYRALWEKINGAGSWKQNPWVWCVSFKISS